MRMTNACTHKRTYIFLLDYAVLSILLLHTCSSFTPRSWRALIFASLYRCSYRHKFSSHSTCYILTYLAVCALPVEFDKRFWGVLQLLHWFSMWLCWSRSILDLISNFWTSMCVFPMVLAFVSDSFPLGTFFNPLLDGSVRSNVFMKTVALLIDRGAGV